MFEHEVRVLTLRSNFQILALNGDSEGKNNLALAIENITLTKKPPWFPREAYIFRT